MGYGRWHNYQRPIFPVSEGRHAILIERHISHICPWHSQTPSEKRWSKNDPHRKQLCKIVLYAVGSACNSASHQPPILKSNSNKMKAGNGLWEKWNDMGLGFPSLPFRFKLEIGSSQQCEATWWVWLICKTSFATFFTCILRPFLLLSSFQVFSALQFLPYSNGGEISKFNRNIIWLSD